MGKRLKAALEQISFLRHDIGRLAKRGWWRWLSVLFTSPVAVVVSYRLSRAAYLLLGPAWPPLRILLSPLAALLRSWTGGCEIHYQAQIGKELQILHPSLGVVISGHAIVGDYLILTGGNCIGIRQRMSRSALVLGNDVLLGANAVVLGPVRVGDGARIGAGSVVKDVAPNTIVGGVPAKFIRPRPGRADASSMPDEDLTTFA